MTTLHIACAADAAYTAYCAAMLHSVLAQHPDGQATIHFLCDTAYPQADLERLQALARRHGSTLNGCRIAAARIQDLPRMGRIPQIMWLRVLLPELLPETGRVLYLDVDTLVLQPLHALWATPLSDRWVAAVDNVLEPKLAGHPARIGLPEGGAYFNSGVLLMNLESMRRERITEQVLDCARRRGHDLLWPDQDALNLTLGSRRVALHPRWNCQNSFYYWHEHAEPVIGRALLAEALAQPAILHFEGPAWAKPWHYLNDHPWRDRWRFHQRASGWPPFKPEGRTLRNVALRHAPHAITAPLRRLFGRAPRPLPYRGGASG